jgi:hypothetical protein
MAGFSPQKVMELYHIPVEFEPVAAIAIGYGLEVDALPEPSKASESGPRSRRPIEKFVFEGQWGKRAPLVSK